MSKALADEKVMAQLHQILEEKNELQENKASPEMKVGRPVTQNCMHDEEFYTIQEASSCQEQTVYDEQFELISNSGTQSLKRKLTFLRLNSIVEKKVEEVPTLPKLASAPPRRGTVELKEEVTRALNDLTSIPHRATIGHFC